MSWNTDDGDDGSCGREVELSLVGDAAVDLQHVEIDADGPPLEFAVRGVVRDVDEETMAALAGSHLTPLSIRFGVDETEK
jgi:hypothetical protein